MAISQISADTPQAFHSQLVQAIDERLGEPEATSVRHFADLYYRQVDLEEMEGKVVTDVVGGLYALWNLLQQKKEGKPKVRVYNPTLDEEGWLCGHTVVAVLQRDMPFLVDSIRIEINRHNIDLHALKSVVLSVARDADGKLLEVRDSAEDEDERFQREALIYMEINLHTDEAQMRDLGDSIVSVLGDVEMVVRDYQPLLRRVRDVAAGLENNPDSVEHAEASEFLDWLSNGHFTFLGSVEYEFEDHSEGRRLVERKDSRLGLFCGYGTRAASVEIQDFNAGMANFHESNQVLSFTKSAVRSRVHRHAYSDYVVVKLYNDDGSVRGESRFLGLYTSPVYTLSPTRIPHVRRKVDHVMEVSGLDPMSHDGKGLRQILETFPRDELFQASNEELYGMVLRVARLKERHKVRLLMRRDPYGKFVSCIIYVPRDDFSTHVRELIQDLIAEAINAHEHEFTTYFSESVLARTHIVFRIDPLADIDLDVKRLERQIIDITRSWEDRFYDSLVESYGEERAATLFKQYEDGFNYGYQETHQPRAAVQDLIRIESLDKDNTLAMSFYQPAGADKNTMKFKVFNYGGQLELSDVVPVLENLGLRVVSEHPYKIKNRDGTRVWVHDFELRSTLDIEIDAQRAKNNFQDAFAAIWNRQTDNDAFNRLVLGARISWREVAVLRAYASYMKQTMFNFSKFYIANTLANHLSITRNLVALFKSMFDPRVKTSARQEGERAERLRTKILESLDAVDNLNEDQIIRRYLDLMQGTVRTNFFQQLPDGTAKDYISFKLSPRTIVDIPEPRPLYEIFVYSPRIEGVHLRGGTVARGGLRWSDRLQDYRTEVLGLVKAQQVKNAVIVPNGAKGGFVGKQLPSPSDRKAFMAEGIACYRTFIRGLLDVTDNIVDGEVKPPENVIRRDSDDPYLVVAADKGTATFSDIANEISAEYGHWLGDAFASGGSQGYDHKKMGITARGAWVSVQRHFKEKGIDVQKEDFTVVGIGDMAGDVFGNGMLMSPHIRLTAAFNHLHIFIDPSPDAAPSYEERKRMFATQGITWADYNTDLISKGGGVFSRAAKSIVISPQMKERFAIDADKLTPNQLIHALLQAPVDLIWNGGIGTYVKAASESHGDVGDKSNDSVRINGGQLRCKVFGEGGNLGMTQLGRIDFCLNGGACNTDFIDNAGGVDCSDHEVNIKILLDDLVSNGDLTQKQRNGLLEEMTEAVSGLVLDNNYKQTQAISLAEIQSLTRIGEYRRFINQLVESGRLDRQLEFLPDDETFNERQQQNKSLTRPELSVLVSYAKVELKEALADDVLNDDDYMSQAVESAFPALLRDRFQKQIYQHRLRREIVATQLANDMVNHMGINFARRLMESTGSSAVDVSKAYVIARDICGTHDYFERVEALDHQIDSHLQYQLLAKMMRRMRRATRWFLRNRRGMLNPEQEIATFYEPVSAFLGNIAAVISGSPKDAWAAERDKLVEQGVPEDLAGQAALPSVLYSPINIVEAARVTNSDPLSVAKVYFALGNELGLQWFANQISEVRVDTFWQAMARETFIDDLESQMRTLACSLIRLTGPDSDILQVIEEWKERQALLVERWQSMLSELQGAPGTDFAMFSVALRELLDLAQASQHSSFADPANTIEDLESAALPSVKKLLDNGDTDATDPAKTAVRARKSKGEKESAKRSKKK